MDDNFNPNMSVLLTIIFRRYRSAYLDRSSVFLPPSSYLQCDGEEEVVRKSNPLCKTPLSLLCVATRDEGVYLYVHGRYPIAKLDCSSLNQMVCSSDLVHLSILQSHSKLSIYSIPALARHRYSIQTISALYSSMQSHLQAIREGVPTVSSSWRNALKPLDVKMDALQKLLTNYGIDSSIRSVLTEHIIIGKGSDHTSALDQYFTGVQMNDQLMVRMEKSLHNGLAGVETVARAALLGPARALVFDANELCGLDDQLLVNTRELSNKTRILLFSIEYLLSQIIEARFRLRDFVAWIRSAASAVKAKGTSSDSVQSENARKRRVSQELVHRVSDYFQEQPFQEEGQSSTETVICSSVSVSLRGVVVLCTDIPELPY